MNIQQIAEKAGLSKFYFQDGKQAEGIFVVGKEFVEKFAKMLLEEAKLANG